MKDPGLGYMLDPETGFVLNTNSEEYQQYQMKRQRRKNDIETKNGLKKIQDDLQTVLKLLEEIRGKVDGV